MADPGPGTAALADGLLPPLNGLHIDTDSIREAAAEATADDSGSSSSGGGGTSPASSGEWGRTPFVPSANRQTAAAYLAQCYEQLMQEPTSSVGPSMLQRALTAGAINEPREYVFIFTNPRSGNQQGRSLMDMALHNFRLRDRPDVQVQIYDITNKASLEEGLHYLHQLQLLQGDRLLRSAFPELFDDCHGVRPSPGVRAARHAQAGNRHRSAAAAAAAAGTATGTTEPMGATSPHSTGSASSGWDEWIADASSHLQRGMSRFSEAEATQRLESAQQSVIKLHAWSAGGDGTVSATLAAMMDHGIDVERVYFSSIPFGTGNDFADALGWGRSVPGDGVGGSMRLLNKIISERLEGYTCKLDIYEVAITTYDDGHIKHVDRDMFDKPGMKRYTCLMINYLSIGVQGFVGSSFELHRPGSRAMNILMYTAAAAKWVFMRRFPPINEALESISTVPDRVLGDPHMTDADRARWLEVAPEDERRQVLLARVAGPRKRSHGRRMTWAKEPRARRTATAQDFGAEDDLPVIQCKPIEIDIQNVARFWGRDIDVWENAHDHGRLLSTRTGVADSASWTPQYAGDGRLELFAVRDIGDYALNQLPGRDTYHIGRLAQMGSPVALHFRAPDQYPPRSRTPLPARRGIEPGLLYAMCDGEFIEMYHPRDVIISRKVTLKAVGRSPDASRIVRDTIRHDGIDAVQMDATAAANKTHVGRPPEVASYVASPFQRFFGLGRRAATAATAAAAATTTASPPASPGASRKSQASGSTAARHSTLHSIRDSIRRSIHLSAPSSSHTPSQTQSLQQQPPAPLHHVVSLPSAATPASAAAAADHHHQAARAWGAGSAVHCESPLRRRQSLNDMAGEAAKTTSPVATAKARLPREPARHPTSRVRSRSLDLPLSGSGSSSGHTADATTARSRSDSSTTSGSSLSSGSSELSAAAGAAPTTSTTTAKATHRATAAAAAAAAASAAALPDRPRHHPTCLDTVGKDFVDFAAQPVTPQSTESP
ncbi:hypothetical protein H4R18_003846 [Coemansia javaensis]|uniref:DAGKc domain-containing protein n=1 Tax=Coemansia javaensis TaxID=2761396 RepID=A0A9W8LGP1_9FUNG|nr:hypothetical protein H4R18_003846 [Coemansia javaensis]